MTQTILLPGNLDLNKQELQKAAVHNLASSPASPVEGQLYYDTGTKTLYYYNGTSWVSATGASFATPGLTLGTSNAAGSASTTIRSDATILAFDATSPATSAVGDSAAVGSATVAARRDHKHAREAFGSVTSETSFGASSANGSATTLARSDHGHGNPTHDDSAHSAIHLNALASATGDYSMGSHKLTNVTDPSSAQDAATKAYVDATAAGIDWKASVRVATAAALPAYTRTANVITATGNGALAAVDGVTLVANDRLLLKDGAAGADNGLYSVTTVGDGSNPYVLTRTTDADTSAEVTAGTAVFVEEGTANADTGWVLTTNQAITLNTTALTFTQFTGLGQVTAGAGLTKTGSTLDVGAGTGISVAADSVAVDTAVVVRKYATDVGDGAATTFTLTHNLGTRDVHVAIVQKATPYNMVLVPWAAATTNTVTLDSGNYVPASAEWRAVIHA